MNQTNNGENDAPPTEQELKRTREDAQARIAELKARLKEISVERRKMLAEARAASPEYQAAYANLKEVRKEKAWHRKEDKRIDTEFNRKKAESVVPEGMRAIHICVLENKNTGSQFKNYVKRIGLFPNLPLPGDVHTFEDKDGDDFSDITKDTNVVYFYHVVLTNDRPEA